MDDLVRKAPRFDDLTMLCLDGKKCVGCHLCLLVCPAKAITAGRKRISRKPR